MNTRKGGKIHWTDAMLAILISGYPHRYNKDLAAELKVGYRSVIRKARELGLEKEPFFLEKRREEISKMAREAHPRHPMKGVKGWSVPNSEYTRFKPGNVSPMKYDLELRKKVHAARNETIRKEKLRLKYDLPQKTKLTLVNIY